MNPERWQRLKEIFARAEELPTDECGPYLESACGGDTGLRAEAEALLRQRVEADGFLTELVARVANAASTESAGFSPGDVLGDRFVIEALLGAGGMGEVYRGRDRQLHRTVALKVLLSGLAPRPDLRQRLEREALAVSRLSHPHICALYDLGRESGRNYLVLEYLEGETLADRLTRGPLSTAEARQIALNLASALAYAHSRGIMHRDLKPGNIMLTPAGAKLLDFGLGAKVTPPHGLTSAPNADSTFSAGVHTEEGMIAGTVAYVSPEQAQGKPLDARSDIFSFGCVLYEMVSGQRAFRGDSALSTLAAILQSQPPPLRELAPLAPPALERLIIQCLQKEASARVQSMEEVGVTLARVDLASAPDTQSSKHFAWPRKGIAAVIALLAAGAVLAYRWWPAYPFAKRSPRLVQLTRDGGLTRDPALSPDGKVVAYVSDRGGGPSQLWLQQVDGRGILQLTKNCEEARTPAFSADGSRVFFVCEQQGTSAIYEVPSIGGEPRLMVPLGTLPRPSPDGRWLHYMGGSSASESRLLPLKTGETRNWRSDFELLFPGAVWSPDSQYLAFIGAPRWPDQLTGESVDIWIGPRAGGPAINTHVLARLKPRFGLSGLPEVSAWLPGDRLVFSCRVAEHRNLWTVRLSARNWQPSAETEQLTSDISEASGGSFAAGRLVFDTSIRHFTIADVALEQARFRSRGEWRSLMTDNSEGTLVGIAPDGASAVFISERLGTGDLYRLELRNRTVTRLTVGANLKAKAGAARISPDGTLVAYEGRPTATSPDSPVASSVWVVPASGGAARQLCEQCGRIGDWLPDNSGLLLWTVERDSQVVLLELGSGKRNVVLREPGQTFVAPRLSPDGRWLAFDALTERRAASHLYVAPFTPKSLAPAARWIPFGPNQKGEGWAICAWAPDGRSIYFSNFGTPRIWAQRVEPGTKRPVGTAVMLLQLDGGASLPGFGLAATRNRLFFDHSHWTGNVWMTELNP